MKAPFATAVALAGTLVGGSALAQPEMRPGLWEHSFTMTSQSGELERAMREMQEQMANMPPEQRQMMEQMMGGQGMGFGPGGQTVRECVTPEEAARIEVPQQDDDCTQEVVKQTSSSITVKFTCAGDPPSSGESEITFASPTAYTGRTVITTTAGGRPDRMTMEQSGKWLSSDCGKADRR